MFVFLMPVVLRVLMLMVRLLLAIALKPFQDLHAYLCNCVWVLHCGGGLVGGNCMRMRTGMLGHVILSDIC